MTASCRGTPISWLALERYQLGELAAESRAAVEAHLATCPACQECLARIRTDEGLALPPLPTVAPAARPRRAWLRLALPGLAAAAAAALLLLWLLPGARPIARPGDLPGPRVTVKGGELVFGLVRERAGVVVHDPAGFAPGDRFQVWLTCPPPAEAFVDLVLIQDGRATFPWPAAQRLRCANMLEPPGAFRLTGGGEVDVCVVLGEEPPVRAGWSPVEPLARLGQGACAHLLPER